MDRRVAVVGAGAAGAATATVLADAVDVTVFEKDAAVGGRSCTRERNDCCYEVGANYLTPADDAVADLIDESVPADDLVELDGTIRPFDGDGNVRETDGEGADESRSGDRRLTCTDGLARITDHLLAFAGVEARTDTRIDALARGDDDWHLVDGSGEDQGRYDAVVLTPPAPLAADLVGRSEWSHADGLSVREAFASVPYRPIASAVLHYPFELDHGWYALVNDDREHPLGWIAREDEKPGQVPDGETLLLAQCSSAFTREHYGEDPAAVVEKVSYLVAGLLDDERLADPDWTDHHCWRYGVPEDGVDPGPLARAADHDLYAAGDWVVGEDRLNGALRSGLRTGNAVREDLL